MKFETSFRPIIPRRLRTTSPRVDVQSPPPSYESVVGAPPPYSTTTLDSTTPYSTINTQQTHIPTV